MFSFLRSLWGLEHFLQSKKCLTPVHHSNFPVTNTSFVSNFFFQSRMQNLALKHIIAYISPRCILATTP